METIILDVKTVDGKIIPLEFDRACLEEHVAHAVEGLSMLRAAPAMQAV